MKKFSLLFLSDINIETMFRDIFNDYLNCFFLFFACEMNQNEIKFKYYSSSSKVHKSKISVK